MRNDTTRKLASRRVATNQSERNDSQTKETFSLHYNRYKHICTVLTSMLVSRVARPPITIEIEIDSEPTHARVRFDPRGTNALPGATSHHTAFLLHSYSRCLHLVVRDAVLVRHLRDLLRLFRRPRRSPLRGTRDDVVPRAGVFRFLPRPAPPPRGRGVQTRWRRRRSASRSRPRRPRAPSPRPSASPSSFGTPVANASDFSYAPGAASSAPSRDACAAILCAAVR